MKSSAKILVVLAVAFFFAILGSPFYVVEEGYQALVLRFGAVVQVITDAGLHYKMPFVDHVRYYSKKMLSWDGEAKRLPTKESQFIFVDTTARWRIADAKLFYETITSIEAANSRLDDIIDSEVKKTVALYPLIEVVRNSNVINQIERTDNFVVDTSQGSETIGTYENVTFPEIEKGRRELSLMIKKNADTIMPKYGIELIDVIIRQIKYSDELTASVYQRMIKERNQVAQKFRSDGEGQKAEWLGKTERELSRIRSQAYETSQTTMGRADGEASRIYAVTYSTDPEFYSFWKAMEVYRAIMPKFSVTASTELDFFKYLINPSRTEGAAGKK